MPLKPLSYIPTIKYISIALLLISSLWRQWQISIIINLLMFNGA